MTHRPSLSRTRKLLGALALGSLFFGGAALAQTTVKYGVAAVSVSYASTLIGVAAPEVFAKHGIKLEITDFRGNSNNCVAAVLNEAVDLMNKEPAKYSALIKAKYFPQLDQGAWDEGFRLTLPVFFKGSTIPKAGWDYLLKLQAATSNKDYSKASYEKILIPEAQVR